MKPYRNSEHYSDPTAGLACENVLRQQGKERRQDVRELIYQIRRFADLAGFSIVERIALVDKLTGKIYR